MGILGQKHPPVMLGLHISPAVGFYTIEELLEACWRYAELGFRRHITFEYVLLDGVNDRPEDMARLAKLLGRLAPAPGTAGPEPPCAG